MRPILLRRLVLATTLALPIAFVACGSSGDGDTPTLPDGSGNGDDVGIGLDTGNGSGDDTSIAPFDIGNTNDAGTNGDCSPNLTARLRDFVNKPGFTPASALDDDFENANGDDRHMVATDLGADSKPVYANPGGTTPTTHGKQKFDWWYRDTPGKNVPFDFPLKLSGPPGGVQTFNDPAFFPLDGRGWNDEYVGEDGKMHNFSFTFELHTTFAYHGGETFTFTGDDDVFVFIAKKLVVDLGGVHSAESKSVNLDSLETDDASPKPVGLAKGKTYPLDIFYNERHTVASHFRMDTSIAFNNCQPIIIK